MAKFTVIFLGGWGKMQKLSHLLKYASLNLGGTLYKCGKFDFKNNFQTHEAMQLYSID